MTINDQVNQIKGQLDDWITSEGGAAYVASDFVHCWEILLDKPGSPRIAVLFEDAKPRVNFPQASNLTRREDRFFDVMISRGRGLQRVRSNNLTIGSGGGLPLFQLAETMRDKLSAMRFDPDSTEVPHEYLGLGRWGKDEGFNLDAFKCSISIGSQMSMPSAIPQGGQPV